MGSISRPLLLFSFPPPPSPRYSPTHRFVPVNGEVNGEKEKGERKKVDSDIKVALAAYSPHLIISFLALKNISRTMILIGGECWIVRSPSQVVVGLEPLRIDNSIVTRYT